MSGQSYLGIPREKIPWAPKIDQNKCIGCGKCLEVCPNNVFKMDEDKDVVVVDIPNNCVVLCDKCKYFCPQDAIEFPDKDITIELVNKLIKEKK